ncbi:MAG: hypothetical protein H6625_06860 [Bdellovibrionaceae bacterium]|nr:hypothetical protein [Pseudobdellovibrionaceae bacterium]
MKKINLLVLASLSLLNLSAVEKTGELFLSDYDFSLSEKSNFPTPPIQIWQNDALVPSYSMWKCFSVEGMTFTCTEHEMEEVIKTPMIAVYDGDETLEIETSPADGVHCENTLQIWRELLDEEDEFCVLAAYLQDLPHENYGGTHYRSLWILEVFKTKNGYWRTPMTINSHENAD